MLYHWYVSYHVSEHTLQGALQRIDHLAHFIPPREDPLSSWWKESLGKE